MLKILNFTSKNHFKSILFPSLKFNFSSASDPYYILGVDKGTDFKQIKKSFFKLVNQYHPDKNDTTDGKKKFLMIKQAFEQIKMQKGLMKPQNFVQSSTYDSVRPNPDQFNPDQEQGYKTNRDYKIFNQKANSDQKYSQFNSSFKTIHDINDIKIKVEEGQMKDSASRFNLDSLKTKITSRSQNSLTVVVIGIAGLFVILSIINDAFEGNEQVKKKQIVVANSQLIKSQSIQSEKQKIQKKHSQRQKKIKHEQLMKIISNTQPKTDDSKKKQFGLDEKNAWSKLIEKKKQDYLVSNQTAI